MESVRKKVEMPYGIKFAFLQGVCFAASFLLGRVKLLGLLPTFAVSLASSAPGVYAVSAAAGAAAGCAASAGKLTEMVAGISSVVAAAVISRALTRFFINADRTVISLIASFSSCILTGVTVQLASGFSLDTTFIIFAEALLSCGGAYVFLRAGEGLDRIKKPLRIRETQAACLALCACVLLTASSEIKFHLIVPSRFIGAFLILVAAYIFKEAGGCIAGVAVGASLGFSSGPSGIAECFSLGGLICGLFASAGQTASAAALTACAGFFAVMSKSPESIAVLFETAAASIAFILIPKRYLKALKKTVFPENGPAVCKSYINSPVLKLSAASAAIDGVSDSIDRVSSGIKKASDVKTDGQEEIREIVTGQFRLLSSVLSQMAEETGNAENISTENAGKIADAFRSCGVKTGRVNCFEDSFGHLMITALADNSDIKLNRRKLADAVGNACGRSLCLPAVSENGNETIISLSQEAKYRIRTGTYQKACRDNEFCGDYFETFRDGHGRQIIVLSDGMGTGGRAAIDAAMTAELFSKLVRAGISFDSALEIVNSALLVNGIEESVSTLDVACIDLYTGETEFMKAGGAATFVRKKNKAAKLELAALPAGILRDVKFEKAYSSLSSGDIILMVSDGLLTENDSWIISELINYTGDSAQEFADLIANEARIRKENVREDDVTVLCMILD